MIAKLLKFKFTLLLILATSSTAAWAKHIVVYGDSLSAAYGMDESEGWAALLADSIGPKHQLTNASISGETTSGGKARLPLTLKQLKPDLVILELGANDGLQGKPIKLMRQNLEAMIQQVQSAGIELVLVGISLPPSYGPRYIDQFRATYKELAAQHQLPFLDFYREDFIGVPGYIQEDGLHPTAVTQPLVRDMVLEFLKTEQLLD